jgi:hypothetical protein
VVLIKKIVKISTKKNNKKWIILILINGVQTIYKLLAKKQKLYTNLQPKNHDILEKNLFALNGNFIFIFYQIKFFFKL